MNIDSTKTKIREVLENDPSLSVYGLFKTKTDDGPAFEAFAFPMPDQAKAPFLESLTENLSKTISLPDESFAPIEMFGEGSSKHLYVADYSDPEPSLPFKVLPTLDQAQEVLAEKNTFPNAVLFKIYSGTGAVYCLQIAKSAYRIKKSFLWPTNQFVQNNFLVTPNFDAFLSCETIVIKSINAFTSLVPLTNYVSTANKAIVDVLSANAVIDGTTEDLILSFLQKKKDLRTKMMMAKNFAVKDLSKEDMVSSITRCNQYGRLLDQNGSLSITEDNAELFVDFLTEKYLVSPTTGDTFGTEVKTLV